MDMREEIDETNRLSLINKNLVKELKKAVGVVDLQKEEISRLRNVNYSNMVYLIEIGKENCKCSKPEIKPEKLKDDEIKKAFNKTQLHNQKGHNVDNQENYYRFYVGYKSASTEKDKEISELRLLKDHIENDYNVLYKASLLQNQHQIDQGLLIHELKEKLKIAEGYLENIDKYNMPQREEAIDGYMQLKEFAEEALSKLKDKP